MSNPSFLCQMLTMALFNPQLVKKLEKLIKKDPRSKSFCSLAQIYFSLGELEKAEKLCLEGLIHNPSLSQAYVLLAEISQNRGQLEKAIRFLTQAKERNPDNPNIYKNLGEIYKKQKDMEKTLNAYKMAVLLKPGDKTALSTVRHLEKIVSQSKISPAQGKRKPLADKTSEKAFFSQAFSEKEREKLAKLNKILARVDIYREAQTV